jgi:hypothetical protein
VDGLGILAALATILRESIVSDLMRDQIVAGFRGSGEGAYKLHSQGEGCRRFNPPCQERSTSAIGGDSSLGIYATPG